jgi:probable phosphoglycerate mutase
MTHLYLIRHGQYIDVEGEWLADPGLSPEGKQQAVKLHDRLAARREIAADVLITSTLLRARQTAEIIAPALNLPIIHDDAIQEWNNEDSPTTFDDFMEKFKVTPPDQQMFLCPSPNCESWSVFIYRACNALNRIATEHAGKQVVVVCHGGIIEAAFLFFTGLSTFRFSPIMLNPGYTSITHWQRVPGKLLPDRWMLERLNDMAHIHN